jgi:hypothetical protein
VKPGTAGTEPHVDSPKQLPAPKGPTAGTPSAEAEAQEGTPGKPPAKPAPKPGQIDTSKAQRGGAFGGMGGTLSAMAGAAVLDFLNSYIRGWIAETKIEQQAQAEFTRLQPQLEAMIATNPKQIHAKISVQVIVITHDVVTDTGVQEKPGFPMVTVSMELSDHPAAQAYSDTTEDRGMISIRVTNTTYSVLVLDVEKERERQKIAEDERRLNERMQALAKQNPAPKSPAPQARQEPPRAAPPSNTLLPPKEESAPTLLPGAPPRGVDEEARSREAKAVATNLIAEGTRLRNESAAIPARKQFMLKVQVWRGLMRKLIRETGNYVAKDSLVTTLGQFDERMTTLGAELGIDDWKKE